MNERIDLDIVTPERRVVAAQVDEVILPSADGYMGVRPGHAPLLAMLDAGEVSYRVENEQHYLAVSGGFAEVLRDSVSIMAATSERAEEIDVERAERSKARAEAALKTHDSEVAFARAEVRLKKAITRIKVGERVNH